MSSLSSKLDCIISKTKWSDFSFVKLFYIKHLYESNQQTEKTGWILLQQNQQHHEGPHPPLPQSLPAPTIRKTVPEHLFPPGCKSPELRSPRPPLKPHANPYLLKHGHPPPPPPHQTTLQPYHTKEKTELFLCNSSVLHTGEWACTNHL